MLGKLQYEEIISEYDNELDFLELPHSMSQFYYIRMIDEDNEIIKKYTLNLGKEEILEVISIFKKLVSELNFDYETFKLELYFIHSFKDKIIELIGIVDTVNIFDYLEFDFKILFSSPITVISEFDLAFPKFNLINQLNISEINAKYASIFNNTLEEFSDISSDLDLFIEQLNVEIVDLDPFCYTYIQHFENSVSIFNILYFSN